MATLTFVTEATLLLAAAGSALWAWKLRDALEQERPLVTAWALSALFIALAVPAQLLPDTSGSDLGVLKQMATNLAVYVSLPLMAAALLALGRNWFWSAAGWGRLLLGLFAGFELTRQMGYGEAYLQTLAVAVIAIGLGGGLMLRSARARALSTVAVMALAAAFAISPHASLEWQAMAEWYTLGFSALCALSLLLASIAIHNDIAARQTAR